MYEYIRNRYIENSVLFLMQIYQLLTTWIITQMATSATFITNHWWIINLYGNQTTTEEENEKDKTTSTNDEPPQLIPLTAEQLYENKNKMDYDKLEYISKKKLDLPRYKNCILFEYLPNGNGNVIMYYNHEKECFNYYSDRVVTYSLINKVGRKYAVRFNCKALYFDKDCNIPIEELSTSESKDMPAPKVSGNDFIKEKKNVFAKLKSYNNMAVSTLHKKNNEYVTSTKTDGVSSGDSSAGCSVSNEFINKYTYEGKLSNFSFLQKAPKYKKMSYSDFKKKKSSSS